MTVSSQTNKVIYIGNGVATEFAIPFSFLEREHIKVRQKKNDIQTERTDWTVKNGNLVFADAPESGAEIAIVREVPLTQETDYRDNEILHAETLERGFDKLTMQIQQLAEKSARAVTVDIFDDTAADSLIPGIRKAVSDCQTAAETSTAQAANAITQAGIAEEKARETAEAKAAILKAIGVNGLYVTTHVSGNCWYREWFSDAQKTQRVWLEQGGLSDFYTVTALTNQHYNINLLRPFSNTDYHVQLTVKNTIWCVPTWHKSSTVSTLVAEVRNYDNSKASFYFDWYACGC